MEKLSRLLEAVATGNPQGVNLLADKYGYQRPKDTEGRLGFLYILATEGDDDALMNIALCHPDKDLIASAIAESEGDAPVVMNASGEPEVKTAFGTIRDTELVKNVIIIAIVLLIVYAITSS
jgi:hypothetical protein